MNKAHEAPGSIVKFISKVQSSNNRKAKEVVLTLHEAIDLSAALSLLLARQNSLLEDIVDLQKRVQNGPTEIILDGGSFDKN